MYTPRWIVLAALLLAPIARRAEADYGDPRGDTFNAGGGYNVDVRSVGATYSLSGGVTNTTFVIEFWDDIRPASEFALNSLFGYIDIDADRDASTGGTARANDPDQVLGPSGLAALNLGVEYYLDFFDDAVTPGTVYLRDASDRSEVAAGTIAFASRKVTVSVPIPGVSGSPRGAVNYSVVVGNGSQATDRGPGGYAGDALTIPLTSQSQAVPEPASLTMVGMGVAGLLALGWRRLNRGSRAGPSVPPRTA
jgi:hypothetical protein